MTCQTNTIKHCDNTKFFLYHSDYGYLGDKTDATRWTGDGRTAACFSSLEEIEAVKKTIEHRRMPNAVNPFGQTK